MDWFGTRLAPYGRGTAFITDLQVVVTQKNNVFSVCRKTCFKAVFRGGGMVMCPYAQTGGKRQIWRQKSVVPHLFQSCRSVGRWLGSFPRFFCARAESWAVINGYALFSGMVGRGAKIFFAFLWRSHLCGGYKNVSGTAADRAQTTEKKKFGFLCGGQGRGGYNNVRETSRKQSQLST